MKIIGSIIGIIILGAVVLTFVGTEEKTNTEISEDTTELDSSVEEVAVANENTEEFTESITNGTDTHDVSVGEQVIVTLKEVPNETFVAESIMVGSNRSGSERPDGERGEGGQPRDGERPAGTTPSDSVLRGTVTAIDEETLTLTDRDNVQYEVQITEQTTFSKTEQ